jgi:thioredoxin 1
MSLPQVSTATFDQNVLQADLPTLCKFTANAWCPPCKKMIPVLEAVAQDLAGKCSVVELDIDDSPETAKRYGVRSIPTLILFANGVEVARQVGSASKAAIVAMVNEALSDIASSTGEAAGNGEIVEGV